MSSSAVEKGGVWIRFRALSWFVRLWFLPVWVLLGACRLAIITLKFQRLAQLLGQPVSPSSGAWPDLTKEQLQRAREIGRVIESTSRRTPWKSNCFTQAVAARIMLVLYGLPSTVIFGVAKYGPDGKTLAHAWVKSGALHVTGGRHQRKYAVLGAFGSPSRGCGQF